MAVPCLALCEHLAVRYIERREQGCRAVPDVAVGDTFNITEPERQDRLSALKRLNLALLVNAQHDRMIRRIEIKPDNVFHLIDEQRISGKLEALGAMGLDAE